MTGVQTCALPISVKGFGIVNKAEVDVFLELSCFFDDPADVGNLTRLVITFLPRSKCLLISWLQPPSAVILEPKSKKCQAMVIVSF